MVLHKKRGKPNILAGDSTRKAENILSILKQTGNLIWGIGYTGDEIFEKPPRDRWGSLGVHNSRKSSPPSRVGGTRGWNDVTWVQGLRSLGRSWTRGRGSWSYGETQLLQEIDLSAAEWLSQHPVISLENNISLQASPNPSLGDYFFQPTLIKNNNKKCGRRKG